MNTLIGPDRRRLLSGVDLSGAAMFAAPLIAPSRPQLRPALNKQAKEPPKWINVNWETSRFQNSARAA